MSLLLAIYHVSDQDFGPVANSSRTLQEFTGVFPDEKLVPTLGMGMTH